MNKENLGFLQDSVRYLGFGDLLQLNEQLEQQISYAPKEFSLFTEAYYEDDFKLEGALYFLRSEKSDMYFFSRYEALLRDGGNVENDRKQVFYISKGRGVAFKEAFNLLQGRSVNKDLTNLKGERYNAWIQLNFDERDKHNNYKVRQFHVQYGYILEKVLEKYPIRELKNEHARAGLLKSLKRGNLQPVHFEKINKSEKVFIEACPQFKSINIYPLPGHIVPRIRKKDPSLLEIPGLQPETREFTGWGEEEPPDIDDVGNDVGDHVGVEVKEGDQEAALSKPPAKRSGRK